jgi:hypothetical protein
MDNPISAKEQLLIKMLEVEKEKDKENMTVILPGFLTKKLGSWMLIREDLLFVKSCAVELINAKGKEDAARNATIEASLWYSLIITYGKCFTENQSGRSRLEPNECFLEEHEALKEVHQTIMELRHGFIAHRGDTENEQAIVYLKVPKEAPLGDEHEFKISSAKSYSPAIEKVQEYINLFDYLLHLVTDKIQRQADKVNVAGFFNGIDQEYWKNFIL